MRIGICGGGIGGLSAAIGLVSLGHDVEVFERAPELRATGAGLNLWPNAGRALYGLGLRAPYDAISVQLNRYLGYDPDGTLLFEADASAWPEKYGAASVGVYRLALSTMLSDAYGRDRIKYGYDVSSVESRNDSAICHFANGESYQGDVIIGADGIHSVIRDQLIGGVQFRPNDHHAFRFRSVIDLASVDVDPAAQTGIYTTSGWLSVIPIGNGKAYWFGSVRGATTIDEFLAFFASWDKTHVPNTLKITPRETIVQSPLFDVDGSPYKWTHGRVTLLGDAAHPMMPDLAQGASQTVIDALALRDAFAKTPDVDQALHDYEAIRRPAAAYIVKRSQMGSFRGRHNADPIAIRYENEVETQST
jgi:2-polyprenyl-6-methoxyphenol hydroxylase-like FAD-dependent oxidoreductase